MDSRHNVFCMVPVQGFTKPSRPTELLARHPTARTFSGNPTAFQSARVDRHLPDTKFETRQGAPPDSRPTGHARQAPDSFRLASSSRLAALCAQSAQRGFLDTSLGAYRRGGHGRRNEGPPENAEGQRGPMGIGVQSGPILIRFG